jgi:hypothetical protein
MSKRFSPLFCLAILTLIGSFAPIASAGTFTVATRDDLLILTSRIQAAQFLTHATFGATEAEINVLADRMRQIGTIAAATEWINNQFTINSSDAAGTPTNDARHLPLAESMIAEDTAFCTAVNNQGLSIPVTSVQIPGRTRYRQFAWWHRAISNPDQLRQKTAWALSQICAVGNNFNNFNEEEREGAPPGGGTGKSRFLGLSNYYDVFINNAFRTYRDVLQDVTYHGIMGDWLSSRGNAKEDLSINRFPDENYAREVMQLFSIGLYQLNDSGVQQLDSNGVPLPTYDQDDIREYAQVFTGLGYATSTTTTFNGTVRFQFPMDMVSAQHDTSSKVLLHGTIAALPASPTRAQCNADITAALNGLFNHQSNPPYICRILIQRFVKSNPSRAYLNRVVQVYKNNGSGVRGDLKSVIRAILLDPEAWQPIRTQYLRNPNRIVVTTMGTEDSRLQEPVLNYTRFYRFFKATARYETGVTALNTAQTGVTTTWDTANPPVSSHFRIGTRDAEFDQSPYESPSVFNFYVTDYQPSGDILNYSPTTRLPNGSLFTPEFQIVNAITSNRTANLFRDLVRLGTRSETHLATGTFSAGPPPSVNNPTVANTANDVTTQNTPTRCRVVFDADATYNSFARQSLIASTLPNTPNGTVPLVEHLDLYLCGGTLHEGYRTKLIQVLDGIRTAHGADVTVAEALEMARAAITCVVTSPSFLVTE